jgi:hypothetical protein
MRIEIAQRFRPFSHLPGTYFILPGTCLRLQVFPTFLKIEDLSCFMPQKCCFIHFHLKGPLDKFSILQDLEKEEIRVWGDSPAGFFRYRVKAIQAGDIEIIVEKAPLQGVQYSYEGGSLMGEERIISGTRLKVVTALPLYIREPRKFSMERLSLGNNKAQDWELMRRRADFAEIFPIWHALGFTVPYSGNTLVGTSTLLEECKSLIKANSPEKILPGFKSLWLSGFEGGLSPRLHDTDFQGIINHQIPVNSEASPLQLLTEGMRLIRSLFIQMQHETISLLPALPPSFHCGRLLNAHCPGFGVLHMEWTKKALRRFIFSATDSGSFGFLFSQGEKSCRVRRSLADRGTQYLRGDRIEIEAGSNYWFDNFQR